MLIKSTWAGFGFILATLSSFLFFSNSAYAGFTTSLSRSSTGSVVIAEEGSDKIIPSESGKLGVGSDKVTVTSNCEAGYSLYVSATKTGGTKLKRSGVSGTDLEDSANYIASSNIETGSEGVLTKDTWGIGTSATSFAKLPEYDNELYEIGLANGSGGLTTSPLYTGTGTATGSSEDYTIYYGANVSSDKNPGTYTGEVLYTVIMNGACLKYTLNFNANGATVNNLVSRTPEFEEDIDLSEISAPTVISRIGYTLTGWKDQDGNTYGTSGNVNINPNDNDTVTLTAQWQINQHRVTTTGGTIGTTGNTTSGNYDYNKTLNIKATIPTGYHFTGWTSDNGGTFGDETKPETTFVVPDNDVNLTANFEINTHTVSIENGVIVLSDTGGSGSGEPGGGSGEPGAGGNTSEVTSGTFNYNETITIKATIPEGHHFVSWSSNKGGTFGNTTSAETTFTVPDADITLSAEIAPNSHTVSVSNGIIGTTGTTTSGTYNFGETINIKATPEDGYHFTNWTSDNGGTFGNANQAETTFTVPDEDVILTAGTEANTYTLAYSPNGKNGADATGTMASQTITYGEKVTLKANSFTNSGYEFKGWSLSNTGDATYDAETEYEVASIVNGAGVAGENGVTITLHAVWESAATSMQTTNCSSLAQGKTRTLTDSRDGQKYPVYRWTDSESPTDMSGYCIMTKDLALGYVTGGSITKGADLTLTTDSSAAATEPGKPIYARTSNTGSGTEKWDTTNADTNLQYINGDTTVGNTTGNAGTTYYSYDAAQKVCPKGWRPPTKNEHVNMVSFMGGNSSAGSSKIRGAPYNYVYGGYFYSSGWDDVGSYGYYWSSTQFDSSYGYTLRFTSSNLYGDGYNSKYNGFSVRCVAAP